MANCGQDSDCRQSDGYVCRNPIAAPWNGSILDDNQSQSVCIVAPSLLANAAGHEGAAICQPYDADAETRAGDGDAASDAADSGDAAPDAMDASGDGASDGGVDSGSDATGDRPADAASDGPADSGSADAPGGG